MMYDASEFLNIFGENNGLTTKLTEMSILISFITKCKCFWFCKLYYSL